MAYYATLGWNISNPITDSNDYDFLAENDGQIYKVQAKTSRCKAPSGNYSVSLTTSGGNQKEYWSKKLDANNVDFVFVAT